ncbi:MAG TPA: UDP-N-acetylmuramate--L-alanine ligase [Candidatus Merdenecus merdavium]|nr:UDP-N-acetylmuramate--L-alanine ligase [Candidatus Merdenecus merdavium]
MYKIDFEKPIHIHFIGIGGISMSGLAEILLKEGFTITGSDSKETKLTDKLSNLGATIYYGQRASNIKEPLDLVVYTAAIHDDNEELQEAKKREIPCISRAELLGQIMNNYANSIAISGTHGKTTTTSMVSQILLEAQADPTISVGGILKSIQGNIKVGTSPYFVTEACEYTNSFLHFNPKYSLILNIEEDHLDFFKDLDDIRHSFRLFAERLPKDGTLIINGEINGYEEIVRGLPCKVLTYGTDDRFRYGAANITFNEKACATYDLLKDGVKLETIHLNVPGLHNVSNSVASIALGLELGLSMDTMKKAFVHFTGTDRRFEYKGDLKGITIIDDYAHHPTEIKATLHAAKDYPAKNIWCIFQPHTYTRTHAFLKEFASALSLSDKIILTDIYAARETNELGISSKDLEQELKKLGAEVYYFPTFDEVEHFVLEHVLPDDLLITMGAGDVVKIGENLLGK